MTLSSSEKQDIKDQLSAQERYLLEVISGDRKTHAVHFHGIQEKLITLSNNHETILLHLEKINEKLESQCKNCDIKTDFEAYKKTMRVYEWSVDGKKLPLIATLALIVVSAWENIPALLVFLKDKL